MKKESDFAMGGVLADLANSGVESALSAGNSPKDTPFPKLLPVETGYCAAGPEETPTPSWQVEPGFSVPRLHQDGVREELLQSPHDRDQLPQRQGDVL